MFEELIVRPIFNLLVLIYAILPGHNFGLALIIFTIVVRLLMWPLVKKQLHHAKAMRALQPEIQRIKRQTKGDRQQQSLLLMQLYKEREISPFGSLGVLVVQIIILIGLYYGLVRVIADPTALITGAYGFIANLPWIRQLEADIGLFDATLFGVVELKRAAIGAHGIYWPAMALVVGSAVAQYYQSKQLMPSDKNGRTLRQILKEASAKGESPDQMEVQAATARSLRYVIPALVFVFTVGLASALALYWLVSGLVAFIQQARVLDRDQQELQAIADATETETETAASEPVRPKPKTKTKKRKSAKHKKRRKRR